MRKGRKVEREWGKWKRRKMRQTKRFTYTRALPAAATWVEPRGASHRHRHRRLARFDALISYLVCCLYLFCRLGERMHPSRMKSCCQQGASDCKLCKLRCAARCSYSECKLFAHKYLCAGLWQCDNKKESCSCCCISLCVSHPLATHQLYLFIYTSIYLSLYL